MNLKLTYQQATALKQLYDVVIIPEKPMDVAERLVKELMIKVYKKLREKLEGKMKGQGYTLGLTDTEAMAYYVYFQNRWLGEEWMYETNFITSQLAELDKQYA